MLSLDLISINFTIQLSICIIVYQHLYGTSFATVFAVLQKMHFSAAIWSLFSIIRKKTDVKTAPSNGANGGEFSEQHQHQSIKEPLP